MGTQRKEGGGGLESVLVLERDTKNHSTMRIRYSADKFLLNHLNVLLAFRPTNIIHIPILCGSVENHDIFFKVVISFGQWVGGEIENGSQNDNTYVVFPRVRMLIPAPHSRLFIFSTQMTAKLPNFRCR